MRRAMTSGLLFAAAAAALCSGCHAHGPRDREAPTWAATEGPGVTPAAEAALAFARAQVGKRYCWGGTGPDCFDCSGLVQAAWRSAGVDLPRTSKDQGRALLAVPLEDARPGDILWWRGHVGLYLGNGEMIDAYHSRAGVVRRPAALPDRVLRVVPSSAIASNHARERTPIH